MFDRCLILPTLSLIAMLASPAFAQTPPSWTQTGMLTCKLEPETSASSLWDFSRWNAASCRTGFRLRPIKAP